MKLPNLLPAAHKKTYRIYLVLLYAKRFLYIQILTIVFLSAVLGVEYMFYKNESAELNKQLVTLQESEKQFDIKSIQAAADRHTERLKAAANILEVRPTLSEILNELAIILPENVTLDSVRMDALAPGVDVTGRAKSREQIVELQNRIEQSEVLNQVYAPLSNLTQSTDASFRFVLTFKVPKPLPVETKKTQDAKDN